MLLEFPMKEFGAFLNSMEVKIIINHGMGIRFHLIHDVMSISKHCISILES